MIAAVLLVGCVGAGSRKTAPPETLGVLPDDLPLPPKFHLDPDAGESRLGEGGRSLDLYLKGSLSTSEILSFFIDHFRLARWKVAPSSVPREGRLEFVKGDETASVFIETVEGGGCRIRVRLGAALLREK